MRTTTLRRGVLAVGLTVTTGLTACATDDRAQPPAPTLSVPTSAATLSPAGHPQESPVQIRINAGDQQVVATLDESAATRDLLAQLPLTVEMGDHQGVEKTGRLPRPLSVEGQPDVGDPAVGDLGYYTPGNDLVLYYGDQSAYPGIVVLGRMEGDAAARIADLEGAVTVRVEALDA